MLDPFEAHPPTQAPDVDKLMNHCRYHFVGAFCKRDTIPKPSLITSCTTLRSLDVRIPILSLIRYVSHDLTLVVLEYEVI